MIVFQKCRNILMNRSNTPSFPRSPQFHGEKKSLIKAREKTVRGFRDLFVKKGPSPLGSKMIASRAPARTKWQMDFWTRSHPLETNSADAALAVSLSVAEFDRWRGAIMRGKFAPRGSRIRIFTGYSSLRITSLHSQSLTIATRERREKTRVLLPLFFAPSYLAYAESVGLFIFGVSKRVTDDAMMLISPCGNWSLPDLIAAK